MPSAMMTRRGLLLILSSPSGAGKTTLAKALLASDGRLRLSISVTTRPQRPNERDGVDYHFVSQSRFDELLENRELLEWAHVFGHNYGTPAQPVETALSQGLDLVFDIDWQGSASLTSQKPSDVVRVFILPPSRPELLRRIKSRNADSEEAIARRMQAADAEMSHWPDYDYVIVNTDLAESLSCLQAILQAERQRLQRQHGVDAFVQSLMLKSGRPEGG
jgi:guanylate kinase